jgi:glycosyltransferase involved in cell wall biosynthesis
MPSNSILIVTDAWHPQVSGPVRMMQKIVDILTARGHRVHVISPADFRTVPLPGYSEIHLSLTTSRRLGRMIEEISPDAIHIPIEGPLGWAARNYCVRKNYKFSTAWHTQFPEYVRARAPIPVGFSYGILRRFHAAATWVLTPTERVNEALIARGFNNVVVWQRGVDTQLFSPAKRLESGPKVPWPRPLFVYAGRVAVEKNIDAFLKLDLPGTKIVVGEGPQRAALQAAYPDIPFLGRVSDADLALYYASADVFVFPSRTDTLGLVLIEALASGTPVAAYPVTGPLDVIDNAPIGVLDEDLRAAALRALDIPRADCAAFGTRFSWDASADEFLRYLPDKLTGAPLAP